MDVYLSKVTSQGQVTLPKEIRRKLGVGRDEYLEFDPVGDAVVVRKLDLSDRELEIIRQRVKKSGITKGRAMQLLEEASAGVWRKYAKSLPRR